MDRVQDITQAYSQAPWRKQLQIIGLFSLAVVFAALIAGLHLSVTARAATYGREILQMQLEIEDLERENADLQAELGFLNSAEMMEQRARNLGFQPIDPQETVYLLVPGYVERQPAVLAPQNAPSLPSDPEIPPEYIESIFAWLQRQTLRTSFPLVELEQQ